METRAKKADKQIIVNIVFDDKLYEYIVPKGIAHLHFSTMQHLIFHSQLHEQLSFTLLDIIIWGLEKGGQGGPRCTQFSEQHKQVLFKEMHNQGLNQMFLTGSCDLLACQT